MNISFSYYVPIIIFPMMLGIERRFSTLERIAVTSGWLVVGIKADCLTRDLGVLVECPPWGVFLGDLSPYLREFGRKPRKALNG